MKRTILLIFLVISLSGCLSNPVPEDYRGPVAKIQDSYTPISSTIAHYFVIDKVDEKRILQSVIAARDINYGRGFSMQHARLIRDVPVKPLTLELRGTTYHAAPMGSTPLTRTLQKSPIMGSKECSYVEEKKVQPGVQAGRC